MERRNKMERELVNWKREGRTAIIVMDNPPVNVINSRLRKELKECLIETENDSEVGVVIITGAGSKAFMAGADIKGFPAMIGEPEAAYDFVYDAYGVWFLLERMEKPTIAALNGLTLGAGLELALCCDIRVADEKAKIGLPEIKLGLFPGGGGTQRLSRLIGKARTKEMIFNGEPVTARKALEYGIVEHVTPAGDSLKTALKIAERISVFSPIALSAAKRAVDQGTDLSLRDGIEREAQLFQEVFLGNDIEEGVRAFLEKRTPDFFKNKNRGEREK